MAALTEDLSVFFDEFAVDGTLAGESVRVIYDSPPDNPIDGIGMAAAHPQVQIATASVPADVEGDTLVVPAGTFAVREHIPDGTGMSLLRLQKAGAT